MRTFVAPDAYEGLIEGRMAELFDEIRRDIHRREQGDPPLIPDVFLNENRGGSAFALIGNAGDSLVDGINQVRVNVRRERRSA